MPTLEQFRALIPGGDKLTDYEVLQDVSKTLGMDVREVASRVGFDDPNRGKNAERLSASVDRYQAGLYGLGEELTKGALPGVSDWMRSGREENQLRADLASARAHEKGAVEQWKDVHGVRDFGDYAVGLGIQSLPYLGEAVVGGIAGRAAMGGARAALGAAEAAGDVAAVVKARRALNVGSAAGVTAASYPSAVGDILNSQREQNGQTDLATAGALGVPYALANVVGAEGALARGTLFRNSMNLLDRQNGVLGGAARATATGARVGATEAGNETFQEGMNQLGRMAVDPNEQFLSDAAKERFTESAIGGFVLGGGMGAAGGGWRRSSPESAGGEIGQAFTQPNVSGTPTSNLPSAIPTDSLTGTRPDSLLGGSADPLAGRAPLTQESPAMPSAPAVPTPPIVVGGTSEIAQATQAAQAENAMADQKLQQQAAREQAFETLGAKLTPDNGGELTIFGQQVFGPQIPQFGTALAGKINGLDPVQQELVKALSQANEVTDGKLVKFRFNANNPIGSADAVLKALTKALTGLQISHVADVAQAANILNKLSETAKGSALEHIDAVHVALTGENTVGFEAAQGAGNGKLQEQNASGLGAVREQGGAGQAAGAVAGDVRPSGVQPVNAGSVPEGSLGLQVGQPAAGGVRAGPGVAADASGSGSVAPAPQVTEVQNGSPRGQEAPAAVQDGTSQPAAAPATVAQAGAPARVDENAAVSRGRLEEGAELDPDTAASVHDQIAEDALEIAIPVKGKATAKSNKARREFLMAFLRHRELWAPEGAMAEMYGVPITTIRNWATEAREAMRGENQLLTKWYAAMKTLAAERGVSLEQLAETAAMRAAERDAQYVDEREAADQGTSRTEEPLEADADMREEPEYDTALDSRANEEGETGDGLRTSDRKSASIQEENNAVETNQAKYLALTKKLEDAENRGDDAEVDRLNAELEKVVEQAAAQDAANKRRVRNKARVDEDTGEKAAPKKAAAKKDKAAPAPKAEPNLTSPQAVWDAVASEYPQAPKWADLTDEQRQDFINYGEENWTPDDVRTELVKLAKQPLESVERNDNPFTDSVVKQPVYHATRTQFDPANMRTGDVGIHFGDMWQAADRGGMDPEKQVFERVPPFEQQNSRAVDGAVARLLTDDSIEVRQAREQLGKRRMLKFFINLKNPLVMDEPKGGAWHHPGELRDALAEVGVTFPKALDNFITGYVQSANNITAGLKMPETQRMVLDKMVAHLKSLGYDGIQYTNKFEGKVAERLYGSAATPSKTSYIVFDKEQISKPVYDLNYNINRLSSDSVYGASISRSPSLRREIAKLQRMLDAGELTTDAFATRVELAMRMSARERTTQPRQRGADYIRQRLLEAKRRGELSERAVDLAEWFILKNPALVDDLAISIQGKGDANTSGSYEPIRRLMTLIKESSNDETTVHEILHHLERMMPAPVRTAIRTSWLKSLVKAAKAAEKAGDKNLKQFYAHLLRFHLGGGSQSDMNAATKLLKTGQVRYDHYQHVNPSEFWAVNGSRIVEGRFDAKGSVLLQLKQWLRELVQKLKAVLGLKSDAAVIKALDSLAKADGKFVTNDMLGDALAYNMFVGRQAAQNLANARDAEFQAELQALRARGNGLIADVLENDPEYNPNIELGKMTEARLMEASGASRGEIWDVTGVERNPDGKQRLEIADNEARFKAKFDELEESKVLSTQRPYKLGDILDHPALYRAYPDLAEVTFLKRAPFMDVFKSTQGWFNDEKNEISVTPYAQDPLSTLLHEVQHWIQNKEGFAPGGNPEATKLTNTAALEKLRGMLNGAKQEGAQLDITSNKVLDSVETLLDPDTQADIALLEKDVLEMSKKVDEATAAQEKLDSDIHAEIEALRAANKAEYDEALAEYKAAKAERDSLAWNDPRRSEAQKRLDAAWSKRMSIPVGVYMTKYDKRFTERRDAAKRAVEDAETALKVANKRLELHFEVLRLPVSDVKYYLYKLISGEAEARNTQRRQSLTAEQRREVAPEDTADVPYENQLIVDARTGSAKSVQFNNIERAQRTIGKLPQPLQKSANTIWTKLFRNAALPLALTEDVVKMASKYMRSANDYLKAQYARQATRLRIEARVEKILQQFDKLPADVQKKANEYIYDSTMQQKWGYYPGEHRVGTTLFEVDPDMEARFKALPANAQVIVRDVFEHGYQMLRMKQQAVNAAIDREFADRERAAAGDQDTLDELAKEKKLLKARENRLRGIEVDKPYAYLARYGDYIVVAKSKEFKHYEERAKLNDFDAKEAKGWLRDNVSNPDHYVVQFAETQGEADKIAAGLIASGKFDMDSTDAGPKEHEHSFAGGDAFMAVKRLRTMAERGGEVSEELQAALSNLYLATVAESSARKSELQRKYVAGADKNMMRNLATSGRADAHFLSSIMHNDDIVDALEAMRKEAAGNRRNAMPIYNELYARYVKGMDYSPQGELSRQLTQFSTVFYLSTSPAFYLQQVLQTAVLSLPFMAGRLGYFRSVRAIRGAYDDVLKLTKGLGVNDHVDFANAPADVRGMLETLVGMGKIDIGIDADAKARAGEQSAMDKVMHKLQGVNSRVETINRATAAIAAYRGYLQRYGADKVAQATQYAADVVSNTHGSYDGFNTPRLLSSDIGRVVGQFKRFQIIQLSMLAKLIHTAFKGASKEEKAIARSSLRFILAHMAVLGGALGVPFVSQLGNILLGVFGDDDEPKDLEQMLRRAIGDDSVADLLLRGVPGAVGLESLGKKVAMENVASPLPFADPDFTSRSGMEKMIVAALGPTVNLSLKAADALGLMGKGDYYKGLEQLMPTGVANAMKGYRFADDGVTMRNGDTVMGAEDIALVDATFQALGLPTNTLTDRQRMQTLVAKSDQFYQDRAAELKQSYSKAYRKGDAEGMQEAREAWAELQEARARNGYSRQPMSSLFRAPMEQAKRERTAVGGVETNRGNRRFVESLAQ